MSEKTSLEDLLKTVRQKFKVHFEPVKIGDIELELLQLSDLNEYIDQVVDQSRDEKIELPFWARIWPTSVLLSYQILKMADLQSRPKILELGAGIGLCGLVAAKLGFEVTISDINSMALTFAQINILKNNLDNRAEVKKIDFCKDRLDKKYDLIIASEILYIEKTYRPLLKFLKHHLETSPEAQAVIAKGYKLKAKKFFKLAEKSFAIDENIIGYKEKSASTGEEERHLCQIYRLVPK